MTETSTPQQTATATEHSPRRSTLAFLRQFARAYTPALGGMVLN